MRNVITGVSSICTHELNEIMSTLSEKTRTFRFVHDLEMLTVASIELLLRDAGVTIPVGKNNIGV